MKACSSNPSSIAAVQIADVGMNATHPFDALRGADHADKADVLGAAFLQPVDGGDRGIGGGEHRTMTITRRSARSDGALK